MANRSLVAGCLLHEGGGFQKLGVFLQVANSVSRLPDAEQPSHVNKLAQMMGVVVRDEQRFA